MKKNFDHIAKNYDTDFTHSVIGKCQRNVVNVYLENFFSKQNKPLDVLEINGGTGEDAIWLSKQVKSIISTDISTKMIEVGKQKATNISNLSFEQLDINQLDNLDKKYDLIFSNFGGLNCLNKKELKTFFESASKLLTKRGKLILVIMPKNTLWERLYFILKLDFKKAFRRNTNAALEVNVANINVKTWYYNPKEIQALAKSNFNIITSKPIGFFIPPSYLENYFVRHKRLLRILDNLENKIGIFRFLSRFSDHYLIELEVKIKA